MGTYRCTREEAEMVDRIREDIRRELRTAEDSLRHARRQKSFELTTYYEGQIDVLNRLMWRIYDREGNLEE